MKIAIIGRSEILYDTVLHLIKCNHTICCLITAKEAPEYSKTKDDFRKLACKLGIPYYSSPNINKYTNLFAELKPDIGISYNYPGILPQDIIDLFPYGVLNGHGGDLPRYRGNACQAWAILNGENSIGLCVHKMEGGKLDSGDIVVKQSLNITINTKISDVLRWMNNTLPSMFSSSINKLVDDPHFFLEKQSNDASAALRCYPRKPEDARIDWHKSAEYILRLINSSGKPYGGAFCKYNEATIKIWDGELVNDNERFCAIPGQIVELTASSVVIACGEGKLRITSIEGEEIITDFKSFFGTLRNRLA